jgi:hypothetical protein
MSEHSDDSTTESVPEQIRIRLEKRAKLLKQGVSH